ncbi:flagellar basal body-associated FliL family protein [Glacieibacterium sp.]|uniref:flagellar basal body-associated FliL family protein n=1 Tax=Glacieibacterium sp. TaxID=2860237 RepID=UPI003AFFDAA8
MSNEPPKPKVAKSGAGKAVMIVLAFAGGTAAGGAGAVIAFTWLGQMPGGGSKHVAEAVEPSKLEYVELDNSFTSNLTDTGRYLQLRIAISTTGGPSVVAALAQHKLAIVSTVLAVLGDLAEADVADGAAKTRLKIKLRGAIEGVLQQKAHLGGVDEVFLTSLVVQ